MLRKVAIDEYTQSVSTFNAPALLLAATGIHMNTANMLDLVMYVPHVSFGAWTCAVMPPGVLPLQAAHDTFLNHPVCDRSCGIAILT
jgi:hypothetical protein